MPAAANRSAYAGGSWRPLAHATSGATTVQGRGDGARQQNGSYGLGVAGQGRYLISTSHLLRADGGVGAQTADRDASRRAMVGAGAVAVIAAELADDGPDSPARSHGKFRCRYDNWKVVFMEQRASDANLSLPAICGNAG